MEIEGLESFITVVEKKSISKAAMALHITQPALSTRVRKLEERLGFLLLERSWDGVRLTTQGRYFLPYAIQLIRELSDASIVVSNFDSGGYHTSLKEITENRENLVIGINRWLAPAFANIIISELSIQFPNLGYKFVTRPTDTLKDLVQYGGIDLGIYYQNKKETTTYSESLIDDEMVLVCSEEDLLVIQNDVNKVHMLNKPFLLFDNPVLANNEELMENFVSKLDINAFHIIDDINIMVSYISSNNGFAILPRFTVYKLVNTFPNSLKILPFGKQFQTIKIQAAYSKSSPFIDSINSICNRVSKFYETEYAL